MRETAHIITTALAPLNGKENSVKQLLITFILLKTINYLLYLHLVNCTDGFCLNGGNCSYYNNCSCPIEWKGEQCQMGQYILTVAATIIINYLIQ